VTAGFAAGLVKVFLSPRTIHTVFPHLAHKRLSMTAHNPGVNDIDIFMQWAAWDRLNVQAQGLVRDLRREPASPVVSK
jgi:hypothetical protein